MSGHPAPLSSIIAVAAYPLHSLSERVLRITHGSVWLADRQKIDKPVV